VSLLDVPHEFLPAFVIAAGLNIAGACETINDEIALDYTEAGRRRDDAALSALTGLIDDRLALLRAFDDAQPVERRVLRDNAKYAMEFYECEIRDLADASSADERARLAEFARIARDLAAWSMRNDISPVEGEAA
jgi:hypothetical protein